MEKAICQVTHDIILAGRCPWCDSIITDGDVRSIFPDRHSEESSLIKWNIVALRNAFSVKPKDYILSALSTVFLRDSRTEPFLPVFRTAIESFDSDIRGMAVHVLRSRGAELLRQEAELYENKLVNNNNDVVIRILLTCYYTNPKSSPSDAFSLKRRELIFGLIEQCPELISFLGPYASLHLSADRDEAYRLAKELWNKQTEVKGNDPAFLGSMADFFINQDPVLSESLYKKAISIEPNNLNWRKKLAHSYRIQIYKSKDGAERLELAKKARVEYEAAFTLHTDLLERFWLLPDLAKLAYEAEEFEKARYYANEMVRMASFPHALIQNNGDAIHYGHFVLGRLALREGDRDKAKWHLLESGKTIGSPVLKSFGPRMVLAKKLLDLGERDVVIQYLTLCSNFWLSMDHKPQQWIYTIEHGGIPDFGPNL